MRSILWLIGLGFALSAKLTPEEAAAKWASRTGAASGDYQNGIRRVQQAPGELAAQKQAKYEAGVRDNVGKWADNVRKVGLGEWQQAAIEKGGQRFAQGAAAAQPKMARFMSEFLPFQENVTAQVKRMDDTTAEARILRAVAQMRGTMGFRRRGGAGGI